MYDFSKAPMGFEPMTFCLQDRRSNQLSYDALHETNVGHKSAFLVIPSSAKLAWYNILIYRLVAEWFLIARSKIIWVHIATVTVFIAMVISISVFEQEI